MANFLSSFFGVDQEQDQLGKATSLLNQLTNTGSGLMSGFQKQQDFLNGQYKDSQSLLNNAVGGQEGVFAQLMKQIQTGSARQSAASGLIGGANQQAIQKPMMDQLSTQFGSQLSNMIYGNQQTYTNNMSQALNQQGQVGAQMYSQGKTGQAQAEFNAPNSSGWQTLMGSLQGIIGGAKAGQSLGLWGNKS